MTSTNSEPSETDILRDIRLALGKDRRVVIWRNNSGSLQDFRGKAGLCVGSSDLIGITHNGRFFALEVKRPGRRPTKEQVLFLALINKMNGYAAVVTSVSEALSALESALR